MSRLGLGLAALDRPGYINVAAYDGGVRYFDAARSYGKAEAFLASWLNPGGSPRGRRPRRPGVIVKEALANGRLTARGDVSSLPKTEERRDVAPDALAAVPRSAGRTSSAERGASRPCAAI